MATRWREGGERPRSDRGVPRAVISAPGQGNAGQGGPGCHLGEPCGALASTSRARPAWPPSGQERQMPAPSGRAEWHRPAPWRHGWQPRCQTRRHQRGTSARHEPAPFSCGRSACHAPGSHPPASVWRFRPSTRAHSGGWTPPFWEDAQGGAAVPPRSQELVGGRSPGTARSGRAPSGGGGGRTRRQERMPWLLFSVMGRG
jgi:hypothetical protein